MSKDLFLQNKIGELIKELDESRVALREFQQKEGLFNAARLYSKSATGIVFRWITGRSFSFVADYFAVPTGRFPKLEHRALSSVLGSAIDSHDRTEFDQIESDIKTRLRELDVEIEQLALETSDDIYKLLERQSALTVECTQRLLDEHLSLQNDVRKAENGVEEFMRTHFHEISIGNLARWEDVEIVRYADRPPSYAGIYFLWFADGVLDYIGQSGNIRRRLGNHHVYATDTHVVCIMPVEEQTDRDKLERFLIHAMYPRQNLTHNKINRIRKSTEAMQLGLL